MIHRFEECVHACLCVFKKEKGRKTEEKQVKHEPDTPTRDSFVSESELVLTNCLNTQKDRFTSLKS